MLAVQADGATIATVEGLATDGELTPLQQAFSDHHALQCGYCTPGMLMSATEPARAEPEPDRATRSARALQGNICRCTGYWNIVEAVSRVGRRRWPNDRGRRRARARRGRDAHRAGPWSGQSVPRKEDRRLVQGQGVFFDDIKRHNMGYVHFVRSPYAHAKISSVDVSTALELPGVYGTLTGDEVAILTDPFFQLSVAPGRADQGLRARRRPGRASSASPVAVVVAETRELARDAAELVEVEYEPLPVIVDAGARSTTARRSSTTTPARTSSGRASSSGGAGEDAVAEADHIVKISELHFDRFYSTPLECDGALVEYNRGTGQWTIYSNNQFPGFAAIMMGPALRCGLDKLRFVTQDIGGGFGNKITSHPQLVACCLLARKLNRAIQWTEWRTEFHLSMSHGNERWFQDTEVAVKGDGTLLGFRTKALDDGGAFTALRAARRRHLGAGHARAATAGGTSASTSRRS